MKKLVLLFGMVAVLGMTACTGEQAKETTTHTEESTTSATVYLDEFVLGSNLEGAIVELALTFDNFDSSKTKEEYYPELFISDYCQNSRMTYDYLEKIREENNGIISEEQIEYIQHSLTGVDVDFAGKIPKEGIDINKAASGFGFGKILSYKASVVGDELNLTAEFERGTDGSDKTTLYELDIILVENSESCFDGYSIKSLTTKNKVSINLNDDTSKQPVEEVSYEGEYNSFDTDEPNLQIQKNEDGTYNIEIGIFRVTTLDCTGYDTEGGIEFKEKDEDWVVYGKITFEDDIATVKIESPDWIEDISEYKYYKLTDAS